MPARRVAVVLVSGDLLIDMFKGTNREHHYRVVRGIPDDARIVGANYDSVLDFWRIGVESSSFDIVPVGEEPPILPWRLEIVAS